MNGAFEVFEDDAMSRGRYSLLLTILDLLRIFVRIEPSPILPERSQVR